MEFYRVHERLVLRVGDITREGVDAMLSGATASSDDDRERTQ